MCTELNKQTHILGGLKGNELKKEAQKRIICCR